MSKRKVQALAASDRPVAPASAAYRVTDRGELIRTVHEILDDMVRRGDAPTDEEIRCEIEAARKQAAMEEDREAR